MPFDITELHGFIYDLCCIMKHINLVIMCEICEKDIHLKIMESYFIETEITFHTFNPYMQIFRNIL